MELQSACGGVVGFFSGALELDFGNAVLFYVQLRQAFGGFLALDDDGEQAFAVFASDFVRVCNCVLGDFLAEFLGFWVGLGFACEVFGGFFESCEIYDAAAVFQSEVRVAVRALHDEGQGGFAVLFEGSVFDAECACGEFDAFFEGFFEFGFVVLGFVGDSGEVYGYGSCASCSEGVGFPVLG